MDINPEVITMFRFHISGVTCGRCEARVSQAVRGVDPGAELRFSADRRELEIVSEADVGELVAAIAEQGYQAVPAAIRS